MSSLNILVSTHAVRHCSESKMDERSYSCEPNGGRDNPSLMEQFKGAVGSLQQHLMEQHTGDHPFQVLQSPPPPKKKPTFILHGANVFCFLSSLPLPPSSHHGGSVWLLPVISLLLPNTESPGRGVPNHMMGEVPWDPKRRRSWAS